MALVAAPASAACYADYKAKRETPLRLHYGVMAISDRACTKDAAATEIAPRLAAQNWALLNVVSVFDESGLQQRKGAAGEFFLRY
ncbi:hypothetical protein [Pseudogemmobacter sp. W21_MBD1_M6]|uniref:hypothetical protein n=1 Tax=Pseudogemmobacter sp. W21_MBD1_M6 TaxID=3240271 RepID=UPI003F97161B